MSNTELNHGDPAAGQLNLRAEYSIRVLGRPNRSIGSPLTQLWLAPRTWCPLVGGVRGRTTAAITRGYNATEAAAAHIKHAAAQPGLDLLGLGCGGDHRGQLGIVPIVKQLIEFFFGPRRGAFGTQIIQNQQRGLFDLIKAAVI